MKTLTMKEVREVAKEVVDHMTDWAAEVDVDNDSAPVTAKSLWEDLAWSEEDVIWAGHEDCGFDQEKVEASLDLIDQEVSRILL